MRKAIFPVSLLLASGLLIFHFITTTIDQDNGLMRKLPAWQDEPEQPDTVIKKNNILTVVVNKHNQLFVEDQVMDIKNLRQAVIDFIDNGGGTGEDQCDYCKGAHSPESSDNPDKAIIALQNERETKYTTYVQIQNELGAAYTFLRDREAERLYGKGNTYTAMLATYKDTKVKNPSLKDELKERIDALKKMYPMKISQAEPK